MRKKWRKVYVALLRMSRVWRLFHHQRAGHWSTSGYAHVVNQTKLFMRSYQKKHPASTIRAEFIAKFGGNGPTKIQIRAGFEEYQKRAHANLELLQNPILQQAWTSILQSLTRCTAVRFRGSILDLEGALRDSIGLDYIFPLDWGIDAQSRRFYRTASMPVGDQLIRLAMECLANGRIRIHELDIMVWMGLGGSWESIPKWSDLNCTELRKLIFGPMGASHFRIDETMHQQSFRPAINAVLKKCQSSLEHFEYQANFDYTSLPSWIGTDVVTLPKLKYFRIKDACISAKNFPAWLKEMPSLDHVQLQLTHLEERDYQEWRLVYDALRDHPNDLWVQLGTIFVNTSEGLIVDYRKSEFAKYSNPSLPMYEPVRALPLYISGKVGWGGALAQYHGD